MKTSEYTAMEQREKDYWWHVGRLAIIDLQLRKHIGFRKQKILNIGCGTGGTVSVLQQYGTVVNVDVSAEALRLLRRNGYKGQRVVGHKLPFADGEFDVVVAFDVLEHIEHDQAALLEWRRVLNDRSGKLLITVPAYQWLWSSHDVSLQHFRRYTVSKLAWDVNKTGFAPVFKSYAITFSLPLVAGFRFLNKLTGRELDDKASYVTLPNAVNGIFIFILKCESRLLQWIRLPFGTTVLGVFRTR